MMKRKKTIRAWRPDVGSLWANVGALLVLKCESWEWSLNLDKLSPPLVSGLGTTAARPWRFLRTFCHLSRGSRWSGFDVQVADAASLGIEGMCQRAAKIAVEMLAAGAAEIGSNGVEISGQWDLDFSPTEGPLGNPFTVSKPKQSAATAPPARRGRTRRPRAKGKGRIGTDKD